MIKAIWRARKEAWHMIEHRYGWNKGMVVSKFENGHVWISFQCSACGIIKPWHKTGF